MSIEVKCVRYPKTRPASGDMWCAITDDELDEDVMSVETRCGAHIIYPREFEVRKPTCRACQRILKGLR